MRGYLLSAYFIFYCFSFSAAQVGKQISILDNIQKESKGKRHTFYLDSDGLKSHLRGVVNARSNEVENWKTLQLPDADGFQMTFYIAEDPISLPEIYNKYPQNKTFKIVGKEDARITGALNYSDKGFSGFVMRDHEMFFIEPTANGLHASYEPDPQEMSKFECGVLDDVDQTRYSPPKIGSKRGNDNKIRTYRIAVAAAVEFSNNRSNNLTTINADLDYYIAVMNVF